MNIDQLKNAVYEGVHFRLTIERPARGVVVVHLAGWDSGELGDVPMRELAKDLAENQLVELFIDAHDVKGASLEVSAEWSQWLATHRSQFKHVTMLTGSPFIQLTANFVRRYADLGEIMKIYTDPAAFNVELAEKIAEAQRS